MVEKTVEIQRKMLGVLMQNARQRIGLTVAETATLLGIPSDTLAAYERGADEAGLPTLEALAEICRVPLSYFWAEDTLPDPTPRINPAKGIALRRKMVGVLLAQARQQAGISAEAAASAAGISSDALAEIELGDVEVPFSQLKMLLATYDVPLEKILTDIDATGGTNGTSQPAPTQFSPTQLPDTTQFPDDVQAFLQDPANILYIKLAMKLHNLSADNLRALAEGILEITY